MRKKLWDENTLCSECKNKLVIATHMFIENTMKKVIGPRNGFVINVGKRIVLIAISI